MVRAVSVWMKVMQRCLAGRDASTKQVAEGMNWEALCLSWVYLSYFFYFWLFWVFVAVCRLSLIADSRGYSLLVGARTSHRSGFSSCGAWARGMGASVVVAHRLSCSRACGIFLDQGLNPCPLHWQVDSYPVYHQRSPPLSFCDGLIVVITVLRELVCNVGHVWRLETVIFDCT